MCFMTQDVVDLAESSMGAWQETALYCCWESYKCQLNRFKSSDVWTPGEEKMANSQSSDTLKPSLPQCTAAIYFFRVPK